jgi:hypothetical protein
MIEFFKDMFVDLYENFTEVFLNIIMMIIIMALGFIVSWFIKKVLVRLLALFRFDKWAHDVGITNFLEKGGVKAMPSVIIGKIAYWIFIVASFSFGLNFIGITQFSEYTSKISSALPNIAVSLFIIVFGLIFANFINRVIFITCENANVRYGDLIAKGVRVFLIIITFGIVFEYMGVGNTIITISFLIIFGGIIMTLSLALGIGLSQVVADLIKEKVKERGARKKGGSAAVAEPTSEDRS